MEKRTTLRDIAREVGVHYSTVSLALRNSPRLPEEMRNKILKAAEKLGYSPDPMLSALNVYRQGKKTPQYQATFAWINNWIKKEEMRKIPAFNEYYEGAYQRAKEFGYELEEFWLHDPKTPLQKTFDILRARNIQGIILAPQPYAYTSIDVDLSDFSVVALGYSLQPALFHLVSNHQYHTMMILMRELDQLGYRRVGLFFESDWNEKVDNGFLSGMLVSQSKMPKSQCVPPHVKKKLTRDDFVKWYQKYQPDVIIASEDPPHEGVEEWLKQMKLRVPQEVGLAYTTVFRDEKIRSGVYQNDFEIGKATTDFLIGMLHRNEKGIPVAPIRKLVEGVWYPGKTVRKKI